MGCKCNMKIGLIVGANLGVVLVVIAAVLGFAVLPNVVDDQIDENVILDDTDSEQYERFEKLPFNLNFSIVFFQINNIEDVMNGIAYPNVTEVGPIVYSKGFEKVNIEHQSDNTIKFNIKKHHEFLPDYSEVEESQEMTVLNAPLISVFQIFDNLVGDLGFIGSFILGIVEKGYPLAFGVNPGDIFHTVTIGEYSFRGYKFCKQDNLNSAAKFVCAIIRLKNTPTMDVDETTREISFSFFQHKNITEPRTFEIENGVNDIKLLGDIVRYDGKERTSFWNDDNNCNEVKGTDSTIYGPHNDKDSIFTIFNTDICRTVELAFTDEIEYEDIPGYRSTLTQASVDWSRPENECYCIKKTKNIDGDLDCHPSGFTDMYNCLDAPIVLSLPHFLWATDESYTKTVNGLHPVEDDHKIYIDMEPNTGSPMVGHKRVQFNLILRQYHTAFAALNKVMPSVMPIVWVDENVNIPESLVDLIKDQYLTPVTIIDICKWVLIGVGTGVAIICGVFYVRKRKQSKTTV